jgi:HTH-type transcriptional regulator/antitoxin HigA
MPKLRIINSQKDYQQALASIESLWDARRGSEAYEALSVLALLVEDYERRTFPLDEPDPVEAIRFRLDQLGKEPKDLVPILGSRSRVSEVMNGKRSLSLPMIRRLHESLQIPLEALIPKLG